jgi:hypothetical protein
MADGRDTKTETGGLQWTTATPAGYMTCGARSPNASRQCLAGSPDIVTP